MSAFGQEKAIMIVPPFEESSFGRHISELKSEISEIKKENAELKRESNELKGIGRVFLFCRNYLFN